MVSIHQATFSQGVLSPKLWGRYNLEQWRKGLRVGNNWLLLRHGGLRKRSGTRFIALAKDQNKAARLLPFVFSTEQSYMLELTDGCFRFFAEMDQIADGGAPYELPHSYAYSEIGSIDYTQSADVMTIAHGNHAPTELQRHGEVDWRLEVITFEYTPSDWGAGNYPYFVGYYNERTTYARTKNQPQTVWHSKAGALKTMGRNPSATDPLAADDPLSFTILTGQVNPIQWMAEDEDLMFGTTAATRTIGPTDRGEVFGPTNSRQKRQTTYGASDVRPVQIGNAILFAGRYRRNLRESIYDAGQGRYIAPDLTIVNEHLFFPGIAEQSFSQDPDSINWVRLDDGGLISVTYERDQQIIGATPFIPGGGGKVEAIATKPGKNQDETWLLIAREVNGSTVRTIEVLEPQFEDQAIEEAFFVDSGVTWRAGEGEEPRAYIEGLDHLEGQEVAVLCDGSVQPRQTVASGRVDFPVAGKIIHAGLPYAAEGQTLGLVDGMPDGTAYGRVKRLYKASLELLRTYDLEVASGATPGQWQEVTIESGHSLFGTAAEEWTGTHDVPLDGWDEPGTIAFRSEGPLPCTITAITLHAEM